MARADDPRTPEARAKLRAALVLLFVFGLPAASMGTYLVARGLRLHPSTEAQPGGVVRGVVRSAAGEALADVAVASWLVGPTLESVPGPTTTSGPDGGFALELPPHVGAYVVRAGGGAWRHAAEEVVLTDGPLEGLVLELDPAAVLRVALEASPTRPVRGGRYWLEREPAGLERLLPAPAPVAGRFEEASFEQGGLAPGAWRLRVELDGGDRVEAALELVAGAQDVRLPAY